MVDPERLGSSANQSSVNRLSQHANSFVTLPWLQLDYLLPADFSGPVRLEILAADGSVIQSFDSETAPAQATPVAGIPRKVAQALTALAIDLEHTDSPPTSSQRELLDYETRRFDQAENEWKSLRSESR